MKPATPGPTGFAPSSVAFVVTSTLVIGMLASWILEGVADPKVLAQILPAYLRLLAAPLLGVSLFALSYARPRESVWRRVLRFLAWGLVMADILFMAAVLILGMIIMSRK